MKCELVEKVSKLGKKIYCFGSTSNTYLYENSIFGTG